VQIISLEMAGCDGQRCLTSSCFHNSAAIAFV
jgi:hypothetical protein